MCELLKHFHSVHSLFKITLSFPAKLNKNIIIVILVLLYLLKCVKPESAWTGWREHRLKSAVLFRHQNKCIPNEIMRKIKTTNKSSVCVSAKPHNQFFGQPSQPSRARDLVNDLFSGHGDMTC